MFKTLIGKFTFFFWFLFIVITPSGYLFVNYHFIDILETSEKEKITFTIDTLTPIIALDISFSQNKQLNKVLDSLYQRNNVYSIKLTSMDDTNIFFKSKNFEHHDEQFIYTKTILDPFDKSNLATLSLTYSNEHLFHFQKESRSILFLSSVFALVLFLIAFLYLRDDLKALRIIASSLQDYSLYKQIRKIKQHSSTKEIQTIATVANEMLLNLAKHLKELEDFNLELEQRVEDGIKKQQKQESVMIHQSRQAAMGEMLESIAHQWRQPLNIIGLAATKLETDYTLGLIKDDEFHKSMDIIGTNINHMSDTIDDFRNFLNPQREKTIFSAQKTIQEVLTIIDAQLENNNIIYYQDIKCYPIFYGVGNEFKQVMLVLLNNSKDAIIERIKKGEIDKGLISITLRCPDSNGIIEVNDNGGGIDKNILKNIFNPYFTTKGDANGTGIGLYIAKNIISKRMDGFIDVRNVKDGACFTISLPIRKKTERDNA